MRRRRACSDVRSYRMPDSDLDAVPNEGSQSFENVSGRKESAQEVARERVEDMMRVGTEFLHALKDLSVQPQVVEKKKEFNVSREVLKSIQRSIRNQGEVTEQLLGKVNGLEKELNLTKKQLSNTEALLKDKSKRYNQLENKLMEVEQALSKVKTQKTKPADSKALNTLSKEFASIRQDFEDVILRLAAFGDDRIQHVEIVGNGKRTTEGSPVRKIITEDQLGTKDYSHLKIPKTWKSHSDSTTINLNFKEFTSMFDVVLSRLNKLEQSVENKLLPLEQKVAILHRLFNVKYRQADDDGDDNPEDQGQKLEATPKRNHQPGASAGRAALNRSKLKVKVA